MPCDWCDGGICRNKKKDGSVDEETCQYKTLPLEPEAIKKRMVDEYNDCDLIADELIKGAKSMTYSEFDFENYRLMDKLSGIKVMLEQLRKLGDDFVFSSVAQDFGKEFPRKMVRIKLAMMRKRR